MAENTTKRRRVVCNGCSNNFSSTSYHRHKLYSDCAAPLATSATSEHLEFLRQLTNNELRNLEPEDAVFFDIPEEPNPLGEGEGVFFDILDEEQQEKSPSKEQPASQLNTSDESVNAFVAYMSKYLLKWQSVCGVTDSATEHQLKFLSVILKHLGPDSEYTKKVSERMPQTLRNLRKYYANEAKYVKYIACTKCHTLYKAEDCSYTLGGEQLSKTCTAVAVPNGERPTACGNSLLKTSNTRDQNGKYKLIAEKVYYYQDLETALQTLINRPGFEDLCEKWKSKEKCENSNIKTNIYDGEIWKDFSGRKYNFLNKERHYAVMLNVDWFQPFDKVNYSVGVVYLVILNLPPEEQFKKENVILVGIIPKFDTEPPTNPFLCPLVENLRKAWDQGFHLTSFKSPEIPLEFRIALLSCGCDIPASRKVCGFLGHMAKLGCNKCLKEFQGGVGNKNYGGFDREDWAMRSNEQHRRDVEWITDNAKTKTEKAQMESTHGVRYSVLLDLQYFDPVRMCIIDPMHNFFLGSAKHHLRVLKEDGLIEKSKFAKIQSIIDSFECPADVGRIPHKLASGFSGLTADQWKNWTLLFSMPALEDILEEPNLKCWQKFVKACRYLCTKVLDLHSINEADRLFLEFCTEFEQLYGSDRVTPNMHLHCHIKDVILDFGPIYAFWLFSFERYNGILGRYSTNNRNIEAQLFRRFTMEIDLQDVEESPFITSELKGALQELKSINKQRGSLHNQTLSANILEVVDRSSKNCVIQELDWNVPAEKVNQVKGTGEVLHPDDHAYLKSMYRFLYGDDDFEMSPSYITYKSVNFIGQVLGSRESRSKTSSCITANWCNDNGDINTSTSNLTVRPGSVEMYIAHRTVRHNEEKWHLLAKVDWYEKLPSRSLRKRPSIYPAERWQCMYVVPGPASYIPVQRIKSRVVSCVKDINGHDVLYICPRERYITCN